MISPLRWVAATRVRLLIAINVAAVVMLALAPTVGSYVRNDSTSPTVDMLLITGWMFVLLITSLLEAVFVGDLLFRHQWRQRFILGQSDLPHDDDELETMHRSGRSRVLAFSAIVAGFALLNGALVNMASGHFLDYYGKYGWYHTVMRGSDSELKRQAIRDISQVETPSLHELIGDVVVPALSDDDVAVQLEALWGLVDVSRRMSRSVDILNAEGAQDDRWEYAMAEEMRRDVAPLGRSMFQTGEGEVRIAAARLLGSMRDHASIPLLSLAVKDEATDTETRIQILVAIGEMSTLDALEPLLWVIEHLEADQRAQTVALYGIGEIFRTWAPEDRESLLPPIVDQTSAVLSRELRRLSRANQCVAVGTLLRMADARTAPALFAAFEAPESSFDCPTEELREHDGRVRTLSNTESYRMKILRVVARLVVGSDDTLMWLRAQAAKGGWGADIDRELANLLKMSEASAEAQ